MNNSLEVLYCIDFGDFRCQGYDGTQNFQGHVKCVAKRLNDNNFAATSVHCLAYCINLCIQEVTRSCKCIKVLNLNIFS